MDFIHENDWRDSMCGFGKPDCPEELGVTH